MEAQVQPSRQAWCTTVDKRNANNHMEIALVCLSFLYPKLGQQRLCTEVYIRLYIPYMYNYTHTHAEILSGSFSSTPHLLKSFLFPGRAPLISFYCEWRHTEINYVNRIE